MFGDKLKKLRKGNNLTQVELSKLLGIAQSSIGMMEKNRQEPGRELLMRLADFFNVSIDYLINDNIGIDDIKQDKTLNEIVNAKEEITDVEEAMQLILSRKNLMLSGKLLTDEDKLALANSLKVVIKLQENELKNKS